MFSPAEPRVVYMGGPAEPKKHSPWWWRWYSRLVLIAIAAMIAAMVLGKTPEAAAGGSATYIGRNLLSWGGDHYLVHSWDTSGYTAVAAEFTLEMQRGFKGYMRWECETYSMSFTYVAYSEDGVDPTYTSVFSAATAGGVTKMNVGANCGTHTAFHIWSDVTSTGLFRVTNARIIAWWGDDGPAPSAGLSPLPTNATAEPSDPFPGWTYCPQPMPSGFIGPPNPSLCPAATATDPPVEDEDISHRWGDGNVIATSAWVDTVSACEGGLAASCSSGYFMTGTGGWYAGYQPSRAFYRGTEWMGESQNYWLPSGTGTLSVGVQLELAGDGLAKCTVTGFDVGYVHSPYFTSPAVQGSNDGTNWTTLASPATGALTLQTLATPGRWQYLRYRGVTASGGGDNGLGGMHFYGQCDESGVLPTAGAGATPSGPAPTQTPLPPIGGGPNPPQPSQAGLCDQYPNIVACVDWTPGPTALPTFGPAPSDSGLNPDDGVPDDEPVPGGVCESDPTLKPGYVEYADGADFLPFNERWDQSFTYENGWGSYPLLGQMYAIGWFFRDLIGSIPNKAQNSITWLWNQIDNLAVPGDCLWLMWQDFTATLDGHVPFGYMTQGLSWLINEFEDTSSVPFDMEIVMAAPIGGGNWTIDAGQLWEQTVDGLGPYRELFRSLAFLVFLVRLIAVSASAIKLSLEPKQLALGL